MQRSVGRKLFIQPSKEAQELLMPMPWIAFPYHSSFDDLEGGEECRCAVALVIVSECAAAAWLEGQPGLRLIQSLDLALFIDAKDHGILRRSEINSDDVGELFQEIGVTR